MQEEIIVDAFKKNGQTVHIVQPSNGNASLELLLSYLNTHRSQVAAMLLESGALLLRGFAIREHAELLQVKEVYAGSSRFDYVDGNSPRTKLSSDVYTSTEYPKEYSISLHNELSYSNKWPSLLFFFCKIPAAEGGETPVVDCRYILTQLDQELVNRFETHGVKYTRYLSGARGVGKSWMDTFETNDRSVVEQYCRENNIEFFWEKDALALSQQGEGVAKHPVTRERVWFNQANQFHPSSLPEDIYRGLKMMHAKNPYRFPQYAFYGNGEEIPEKYLKEITEVHFDCALKFKWEQGDVLMLDNMLMAHGRMPFRGDRKILVSMC